MTQLEVWGLRGGLTWLVLGVTLSFVFLWPGELNRADDNTDILEALRAEIMPLPGTLTSYGIPLVLENTRQFLD